MIQRFIEVVPKKLYRGSAPTPQDVVELKNKFNIKKIVSLDEDSAKKIKRTCKLLGIKQVVVPINLDNLKRDLLNLFSYNLKDLLLKDCPTFIHCQAGKDRTGLVIALFKCKYLNEDPDLAIEEAEKLGFGLGIESNIVKLFKKLIRSCKPTVKKKTVNYDIVSNEREYISDNRSSFLDEVHQGSFAPYLDHTKQYPMDALYNYINDQSPTRENYSRQVKPAEHEDVIPIVGLYNNDAGVRGFGPVENQVGFFYD